MSKNKLNKVAEAIAGIGCVVAILVPCVVLIVNWVIFIVWIYKVHPLFLGIPASGTFLFIWMLSWFMMEDEQSAPEKKRKQDKPRPRPPRVSKSTKGTEPEKKEPDSKPAPPKNPDDHWV